MVTILPKETGWGEAFANVGKGAVQGYQDRTDEMALQKAIGALPKDYTPRQLLDALTNTKTYSPASKQTAFKNLVGVAEFEEMQTKNKQAKEAKDRELDIKEDANNKTKKTRKSVGAIKNGLQTVQEMMDIGKKGNLGRGSGLLKEFGGETAKDFSQYEQLGKSLIQLSTDIPIRNRQEFETLAHKLYDPTELDSSREGTLTAMRNILQRSLLDYETEEVQEVKKADSITPEGKIRVRNKETGKTGTVTPYEGMDAKYERI